MYISLFKSYKQRRSERRNRESARISSSSGDSLKIPECNSNEPQIEENRDSKVQSNDKEDSAGFR
jgi:hypothetical protein